MGCDGTGEIEAATEEVSIHAPAWGATPPVHAYFYVVGDVSIHAPAWGATPWSPCKSRPRMEFQSTHPRGVRHLGRRIRLLLGLVSIHAPAWGATPPTEYSPGPHSMFQSTHPRGVRHPPVHDCIRLRRVSIHAPAWGATYCREALPYGWNCFNPRTRVGCDKDTFS